MDKNYEMYTLQTYTGEAINDSLCCVHFNWADLNCLKKCKKKGLT